MSSVYGEAAAQELADEEWLADAGARGWIVLMKDAAIRRRPAERDALAAGVRAFCLTNANLRADQQTQRFIDNLPAMFDELETPGPWIAGVYADGVRRIWP